MRAGLCARTWVAASAQLPVKPQPPTPQKPEHRRGGNGRNQHPFRFVGPEEKWQSAGAGDRVARVTRRLPGFGAGGMGLHGRRRAIATRLLASAIFYSPGLPPRPRWLRVSLPAADRDPGWAGWASARRGWTEGGEAGRKRKGRAARWPQRGVEA